MPASVILFSLLLAHGFVAQAESCDAKFKKLVEAGVPMGLLNQMAAKVQDRAAVAKDHIALIDYSKPAAEKRMFIINLEDGSVQRHRVSHGRGNGGHEKATEFTLPEEVEQGKRLPDAAGSRKVSLGLYLLAQQTHHSSKAGKALTVQGLEKVNRDAHSRQILVQGCSYVSDQDRPRSVGLSWGSFCVDRQSLSQIIKQLQGSVLYAGLSEKAKESDEPGPEALALFRCQGKNRSHPDRAVK